MYIFVYIAAFVLLILSFCLLILAYRHSGHFFGFTLSQWVERTRRNTDEISAEKLRNVRKLLEVFAHDVLKHRLLGLHSLFEDMQTYYNAKPTGDSSHVAPKLTLAQDATFRDEFFRICGLKAKPEERLWVRWRNLFQEISHYTGKKLVVAPVDPMFSNASRVILELQRTLVWFVENEKVWKRSSKVFYKLLSLDYVSVYPATLELADACRMILDPDDIVANAIEAVTLQTKRANVAPHIKVLRKFSQRLLSEAPEQTLVMCLTRLLDNALEQADEIAVDVSFVIDPFTGAGSLLFKVYDTSENCPSPSDEGMGLRGIRQNLETFGGGILYKLEQKDAFKKAAVISIPASPYRDMKVTAIRPRIAVAYVFFVLIQIFIFLTCLFYVIGGPPVQFAGTGSEIVEFYVEVGQELDIPLCTGGRNVKAYVEASNAACSAEQCSFADVLSALDPCRHKLSDPNCPKNIKWIPQFADGQRQGKNYELSIQCIADGPPPSEDTRKIRILVTRPNSEPKLLFSQMINETTGETHNLSSQTPIRIGIDDKLKLRLIATDADTDAIIYKLIQPDGKSLTSYDGVFALEPSWSPFATATFEVEITDNLSAPIKQTIVLEAARLHPIDVKRVDIAIPSGNTQLPCEGSSESFICHLPDSTHHELKVHAWFDPLQTRIHPILNFTPPDNNINRIKLIRAAHSESHETKPGDQWEIYTTKANLLAAVIELTNIEKINDSGDYAFTFRLLTPQSQGSTSNLALNLEIGDLSGRIPPYKGFAILAFMNPAPLDFAFLEKQFHLTEFENDADKDEAKLETWIYPLNLRNALDVPAISKITCQTPEFESAFDVPVLKSFKNAWRVDIKLKKGCIPGLTSDLTTRQRLCTASLLSERPNETPDSLWIMLESRECSPVIQSLQLTASKNDLDNNQLTYKFLIDDPDRHLSKNGIRVENLSDYTLSLQQHDSKFGSRFAGDLAFSLDCSRNNASPIALVATDSTGKSARKLLSLPQICPSPIATSSGETHFDAIEDELLQIPLKHDDDVTPVLLSRFGEIQNDTFLWMPSCSYGKGPLSVEIGAKSANAFGNSLKLTVNLHCKPRFSLSLDDAPMPADNIITIGKNHSRQIRIQPIDSNDFDYIPSSAAAIPALKLQETKLDRTYILDIACNATQTAEDLSIQILPPADAPFPPIAPLQFSVHCLDE